MYTVDQILANADAPNTFRNRTIARIARRTIMPLAERFVRSQLQDPTSELSKTLIEIYNDPTDPTE